MERLSCRTPFGHGVAQLLRSTGPALASSLWIRASNLWITTEANSVLAPMNLPRRRSIVEKL